MLITSISMVGQMMAFTGIGLDTIFIFSYVLSVVTYERIVFEFPWVNLDMLREDVERMLICSITMVRRVETISLFVT